MQLRQEPSTLGQLWLRRDGAYLRARRMMPPSLPWPPPAEREHELTYEQAELLAEYRWLDEQVRHQRHQIGQLSGAHSA